MTLRSQAHALIGRFIADIDTIIRDHAERAAALALAERGLTLGKRAKRLGQAAPRANRLGSAAPLELVPPEPNGVPKGRKKQQRAKSRAKSARKTRKTPRASAAEQLTLF